MSFTDAVAYLFARRNNASESTSFSSDEEWNAILLNYNHEKRILRLRILWYDHMSRCERLVAKVMTSSMTFRHDRGDHGCEVGRLAGRFGRCGRLVERALSHNSQKQPNDPDDLPVSLDTILWLRSRRRTQEHTPGIRTA
ncbi:hypothetical protein PV325_006165 [Microctonus aethiopoides]|uniref:Uncharacterized protein n=1 Tax=Microctonus aethiopoides TaxID=144406 RepID=A0AA39F9S9_9HYME|nr:hypothetical protein PV325_006165 [Microctonus aethiopoides]KAK0081785.1 hypothetical protein PV326_007492 [Microctonus aethiopoides]KAK0165587.1 hypothetical protein PV328_004091 [Microctonus aethiopoides]